jgi:DNA-directed RNA polymerase specialized sigma24 family protein
MMTSPVGSVCRSGGAYFGGTQDQPPPWWTNNPELEEIKRRALAELLGDGDDDDREPAGPPKYPDPVLNEVLTGACKRELGAARDDVARARERYADAVLAARTAGLSWGEIGRVLGVSRQQLHRRFSRRASA